MSDFLMATSEETLELLDFIADEMVSLFSLARAEAVARINEQWQGQDLSSDDEVILHEDEYYWALWIYYGGKVSDWSPEADRSAWVPRAAPSKESGCWTIKND